MSENWYNGTARPGFLQITVDRLYAINANAFSGGAFDVLSNLAVYVDLEWTEIRGGALNGLPKLLAVEFDMKVIVQLPVGLYNPIAPHIEEIIHDVWPNNINLNAMFAGDVLHNTVSLKIQNVQAPQTVFRLLSADNFTAFQQLYILAMTDCGIEMIDERAFDPIVHTLHELNLERNLIKFINVNMFRQLYETKSTASLWIMDGGVSLVCTCSLIEIDVMVCPFQRDPAVSCLECALPYGYKSHMCHGYRDVNIAKFRPDLKVTNVMRIIEVRLKWLADDSIMIKTNFSSKIRMIFKDLSDKSMTDFGCVIINKFVDHMRLDDVEAIQQAEYISITAIPLLSHFSARPLHSITIRREKAVVAHDDGIWMELGLVIIFATLIGFCAVICWKFISQSRNDGANAK